MSLFFFIFDETKLGLLLVSVVIMLAFVFFFTCVRLYAAPQVLPLLYTVIYWYPLVAKNKLACLCILLSDG